VTVQDEGFHEIQLNGKQVVFLFMAATVVSVVIFLCGVLVGRGVRVDRPALTDLGPGTAQAETTPPSTTQAAAAPATPSGSDPRSAAPPPDTDDLSYFNRLETKTQPRENLKAAVEKRLAKVDGVETVPLSAIVPAGKAPAPRPAPEKTDVKAEKPKPEKTISEKAEKTVAEKPAPPAPALSAPAPSVPPTVQAPPADEPAGSGFAVQIAALNVRGEAEAIAKRLTSKGYSAYVLVPSNGTPSVFRVRIGKFPTRHEAETVAAKLKKEEQFNPWVTR
jgi:cell division septation protein DedD